MDFLGLRTLTVIRDAENMLFRQKTQTFAIAEHGIMRTRRPIDMLLAGETEGVFQLESSGMNQVLHRPAAAERWRMSSPSSPCTAPAPWIPSRHYLRNRHEPEKISYKHAPAGAIFWM